MKLISPVFLSVLSAGAAVAAPPGPPVVVTASYLDEMVAEARASNPGLQAAEARRAAAVAAAAAVRTWEDPTASVGVAEPSRRGFKAAEEGDLVYGFEQKLPLFGKTELMRKVAAAEAARERALAEGQVGALRRDVAAALYALARADEETAVAEEDVRWLEALEQAVDHRYRVGQASQVDWLKAETERAMAADELNSRRRERDHACFALNRLLNRELHAPWPAVAMPELQPAVEYTPALAEAAVAAEPELRVAREEAAAARAAAELTRRGRRPDVSLGVEAREYSRDAGLREGALTVRFTVPWFNRRRYDEDWRRDRLRQRASELSAEDRALAVQEELHHHLVDLDAARRQAVLYRDQIIPLSRQTLASAQSAWEHGTGPIRDVLDAHRQLLANRLTIVRALTDQATRLADICFLTGRSGGPPLQQ